MITLILTASNFTNVILLLIFVMLFLFKSTREQKSIMAICVFLLVIFLVKFSPQNDTYINDTFEKYVLRKKENLAPKEKIIPIRERPDSLLDADSKKEKIATLFLDSVEREEIKKKELSGSSMAKAGNIGLIERPQIPGDSIHTASFQWKRDTTLFQRQILSYAEKHNVEPAIINSKYDVGLPGKLIAFKESLDFFKEHRGKIICGNGTGNFSSKLAFRATGLKIAGGYPKNLVYNSPDFLNNHFSLYTYFFTKNAAAHSLINNPASVYDQLLTEYGLAGIAVFIIYYAGFFLKHLKVLSYGIPLLAMMLAVFMVDYWFEQLSIVVLFELMMFINIKENTKTVADE